MKMELIKKVQEAADTFSFIFKPENEISWEAGQYILYRIPHKDPDSRGIERFFTIASAPYEKVIMLSTRFDPLSGSSFKRALFGLETGSVAEASDIKGGMVYKEKGTRHIFIAGGIGITPFRAILLDLAYKGIRPDATLIYGNRNDDFPFKDTFDKLNNDHKWLDIDYVTGPRHIDKELIRQAGKDICDNSYYVSGPVKMVQSIRNMLLEENIGNENMLFDYFPGIDSL
jgi:glycine betaine catabolism B